MKQKVHLIWESDSKENLESKEESSKLCYEILGSYLKSIWNKLDSDNSQQDYFLVIANIEWLKEMYTGEEVIQGLQNSIQIPIQKWTREKDKIEIYQKGGNIYTNVINSSGHSHFKIYKLSEQGKEYYFRVKKWLSKEDYCNSLEKNEKYHRCIHTFDKIYK